MEGSLSETHGQCFMSVCMRVYKNVSRLLTVGRVSVAWCVRIFRGGGCFGAWVDEWSAVARVSAIFFQYLIILYSNVLFECETGQRVNEIPVTDFSSTTCPSIKRFPHIDTFWWFKISSWKREFSQCVRDPKRKKNINWKNVCVLVCLATIVFLVATVSCVFSVFLFREWHTLFSFPLISYSLR
jgi:hypothetical protein